MEQAWKERYLTARRAVIARSLARLNEMQREAAMTTEGPLLLLAGAGSGKTTVLIHRIATLIRYGCASDSDELPEWAGEQELARLEAFLQTDGPSTPEIDALCALRPAAPWSILAITFTNKAANELKERLERMLGPQGQDVWAMTFHAACCRILRREIAVLGYDPRFTIYDTADSERVMKDVITSLQIDEKVLPPRLILSQISRAKDAQRSPEALAEAAEGDVRRMWIAKAYAAYQRRLKDANALDFDDIILLTVQLLQEHAEVRDYYQRKFRYVLVDEYQDTNVLQYQLVALLTGAHQNVCVVGDDDQSIYKFRGATIENILSFEKHFPGAKLIRLEQNYRSTQRILDAANEVIRNNNARKGKRLWTENGSGERITVYEAADEAEEANFVAGRIFAGRGGAHFRDYAVLYRTNAQSNAIERSFKQNAIPYRIIGGTRFYDRAEVKDMVAYLCLINNHADDLRLRRILNNPPRGIGDRTVAAVERLANASGKPIFEILEAARDYPVLEKSVGRLAAFTTLITELGAQLQTLSLPDFYDLLLERSGYAQMLEQKGDVESRTRLDNIHELRSSLVGYEENHPDDASLAGFLEEVALYTDIEQYDKDADAVVMMTMHAAKGLEFPNVFLVGMEEGLFPSQRSIGEHDEMEEERRLCYVAITRAKKTLCMSFADRRMLYGHTVNGKISRFVEEIPDRLVQREGQPRPSFPNTLGGYGTSFETRNGYGDRGWGERSAYGNRSGYGERAGASSYGTRQSFGARPTQPTRSATGVPNKPPAAPLPDFKPGSMVEHKAFGKGMVISALPMGNDALLEIAFDTVGTKRLMARTAMVHMKLLG